ncbi:ABC transporter ATP-binding protein [Bradyrhizobium sp. USDA 336]|uniref:ABC transporter ATP-binding protein n=1 Tax=Bradyrhizobium sp. USDA 336 TaxID=3156311 RepID=UPI00383909D9
MSDVSFVLAAGETLGIIGESGSGKSTLGRMISRLLSPSHGRVFLGGQDLTALRGTALRRARLHFQVIQQDPNAALNPRMQISQIVEEPLRNIGIKALDRRHRASEVLNQVGLGEHFLTRLPGQLSGGQKQRVCIARAIVTRPKLIIADEPTSALDVKVQAQIITLLAELKRVLNVSLVLISHNVAVVAALSDRIAVMHHGSIVETGLTDSIIDAASHPYTQSLIASVLDPHDKRQCAGAGIGTGTSHQQKPI